MRTFVSSNGVARARTGYSVDRSAIKSFAGEVPLHLDHDGTAAVLIVTVSVLGVAVVVVLRRVRGIRIRVAVTIIGRAVSISPVGITKGTNEDDVVVVIVMMLSVFIEIGGADHVVGTIPISLER